MREPLFRFLIGGGLEIASCVERSDRAVRGDGGLAGSRHLDVAASQKPPGSRLKLSNRVAIKHMGNPCLNMWECF